MGFGNQQLRLHENILSCIFFFFYGCTYLEYYNTLLNLADVLTDDYLGYSGFMTTFPMCYNAFNFVITVLLTVLASKLSKYPFNIFAHTAFLLHLLLFIVSPMVLVLIPAGAWRFWTMVIVATFSGLPTPMNSSVFMGLSGLFSPVHNAIFFIGMAAGGLISWFLRFVSNLVYPDNHEEDIMMTFILNGMIVILSHTMYIVMYHTIPFTQQMYVMCNSKGEETKALVDSTIDDEVDEHGPREIEEQQGKDNYNEDDQIEIKKIPFSRTFIKLSINLASIGLVFFVTLSTFPGLFSGTHYDTTDMDQDSIVRTNTMIFMFGDLLSRFCVYIPIKWNKWVVFGCCLGRFLFYIPVFIYYYGTYTPYPMFVIMLLFSFTNGYFSAVGIQLANESMLPSEKKVGGNLVMLAMNIGLTLGALLLFVFGLILDNSE